MAAVFRWVEGAFVLALFAGILGCATGSPKSPEEAVREKSIQRWEALIRNDFAAAYEYMSPGSRAVVTKENYVAMLRKDFWKSAVVDKVDCQQDACQVRLTIEYELQGRRAKTPLLEKWIREGSNWWYVQG